MSSPQPNPSETFESQLQRLVDFEPTAFPVISLYLNTQPDEHGRDRFESFLRHELDSKARTFAAGSPEAESFQRDAARIREYIEQQLRASANGVAIFACSGAGDFFEALQLTAPVDQHKALHLQPAPPVSLGAPGR